MNGNDLKIKLKKFNIELKELAEKLKISPQALNNRLSADDLKVSFVVDVANIINKSVYDIIDDKQESFKQNTNKHLADVSIESSDDYKKIFSGQTKSEYLLRTDIRRQEQLVPLFNLEAAAGLVQLFQNDQTTPIDYISIPNLPKCDGAIYVVGDSMYPLLKSGDIVMYKQVQDITNSIFWGEMYIVHIDIDGDAFTTVKYVQKSDVGPDYIKLVSQNQHHSPKDINIRHVKAAALVKASIRINSMM